MVKLDINVLYNINDRINIGLGSSFNVILMAFGFNGLGNVEDETTRYVPIGINLEYKFE